MTLTVFIPGSPAPQGSKNQFGGESCKRLPGWRSDVRNALLNADNLPKASLHGPVFMVAEFVLPRPKSMAKKRVGVLSETKPDYDKLLRAMGDAITSSCVFRDDAQIAAGGWIKRIAEIGETPGCHLFLTEVKTRADAIALLLCVMGERETA